MSGYLEQVVERLKSFEGSVPWMYLDTVGKVTVGVGSMLPDARAAATLPFVIGGRAATADEVSREFARVSGLEKGKAAKYYRKSDGLRLSDQAIDGRLLEVLHGFEGYLRAHLGAYETLPDAAKAALLDMIYNLGPGKLFHEYPKLIQAIERRDWACAAGACLRRGPSSARNSWTRQQFLDAAKAIAVQAEEAVEQISRDWLPVLLAAAAALLAVISVSRRAHRRETTVTETSGPAGIL